MDVPGGPLDQAATIALDRGDNTAAVTAAFEVKNLREWIYPKAHELYQLLEKAALLQQANPNRNILPVFICRRAQWLTFTMAKDLGFMVFQMREQPLLPHTEVMEVAFTEVTSELSYSMTRNMESNRALFLALTRTIPEQALQVASRWRTTAQVMADYFGVLSHELLNPDVERAVRAAQAFTLTELVAKVATNGQRASRFRSGLDAGQFGQLVANLIVVSVATQYRTNDMEGADARAIAPQFRAFFTDVSQ